MSAAPAITGDSKRIPFRISGYILIVSSLFVLFLVAINSTWQGSSQIHTSMEIFSATIAAVVSALSFVRFYSDKSYLYLFLASGFLATTFLDGYHAIVTSSAMEGILPSAQEALIPWSWNASRCFLGVLLCMAAWPHRRDSYLMKVNRSPERIIYLIVGIVAVFCFLLFTIIPLPNAHFRDMILLSRPQEHIAGILLLIALVGFLRDGRWKTNSFEHWIVISLLIGIACQSLFMASSFGLFNIMFDIAHSLKALSYICVLVALLSSSFSLFKDERDGRAALALVLESLYEEVDARKVAEAELLQRKNQLELEVQKRTTELSETNNNLETMLYVASHDLREPLRSMQNFSSLVLDRYADKLDEKGVDFLTRIVRAGERMDRLMEEILMVSRARRMIKPNKLVGARVLIDEAVESLRGRISSTNARIEIMDTLPALYVDRVWATQIIQNLLANALKFVEPGEPPDITIEAYRVATEPNATGLAIKDRGTGVPENQSERIFGLFQRGVARSVEGTGAGLAIVRQIVDKHDGSVKVVPRQGGGSVFTVTFGAARD